MDSPATWLIEYQREMSQAVQARAQGNEGKARVCARRAASLVVGEYLRRRGISDPGPSVYDRIELFSALPDVQGEIKSIASHFTMRVTPEHSLPIHVDLLAEADWLKSCLLAD